MEDTRLALICLPISKRIIDQNTERYFIKMAERQDKPHKIAEVLRAVIGKTEKKYYTSAIILAAGSSTRMGKDQTKQFIELCGIPVVVRTLQAFEASPLIDEIIVVAKADEIEKYADR